MIEKLKEKETQVIDGCYYDCGVYKNRYTSIKVKPDDEDIINKINEIIDYLNSKEE